MPPLLTLEECVEWTLRREGAPPGQDGFVDDKDDPGGVTKFGIAQRYHPDVDVRNLTREGAVAIYRKEYWEAVGAGGLPGPLRLLAFDSSVNPGLAVTLNWLRQTRDPEDFRWLRLDYYRTRPLQKGRAAALKYLPGWILRQELERRTSR